MTEHKNDNHKDLIFPRFSILVTQKYSDTTWKEVIFKNKKIIFERRVR